HDTYEFVVDSFKEYDNVEIVRGIVPQSLSNVEITKVAFLSIDMNIVMPDRAALEHFWPKMSRGGIIIVDDYAMQKRHLQQESVNDFAASVGVKILTMPTGQGIIIKP
ncbi:MAG: class I SAM-dependent methyltransferase, partial [Flavobacteriales bacterium]|nr:class I SAM-dependent methyltransferase [Flavobacteriales bacterium]